MTDMQGKQWAVRGPGMPQKILRSDKPLSEAQVKKLYLSTVKYKASDIDRGSTEVPFKIIPVSDDDIQKTNLGWCLRESRRRNHRALIQVKDGKIVEDVKEVVRAPRTRTKVDVSATQKK